MVRVGLAESPLTRASRGPLPAGAGRGGFRGQTKKPASPPASLFPSLRPFAYSAASSAAASCLAIAPLTADCTFSKARTSIWRTRSRDILIGGQVFQRHRLDREATGLEDAAFARVEHAHRAIQSVTTMIKLLALGHQGFLVGRVVDQPVLPFAGFAVVADRRVERGIAAEPAVHVDHVLSRHAETLGDDLHLVGADRLRPAR